MRTEDVSHHEEDWKRVGASHKKVHNGAWKTKVATHRVKPFINKDSETERCDSLFRSLVSVSEGVYKQRH